MGNRTHKRGENEKMSDVADLEMARDYVLDIGGPGKGAVIVDRAFKLLAKLFPHDDRPKEQWTSRRVRSFLEREAALVRFREMVELHRAAEHAKAERALIEKARKEHAAFIEKTASLRALLERQDEDFHRPQIEGLGGGLGGMDRPGTEG